MYSHMHCCCCCCLFASWMLVAALAEDDAAAADPCSLPGKGSNAAQLMPPHNFTEGANSVGAQASVEAWLQEIDGWRTGCRAKLQLNGSVYESVPQLKWTQSTFIQPQIHPWDNYFYNATVCALASRSTTCLHCDWLLTGNGLSCCLFSRDSTQSRITWPTYGGDMVASTQSLCGPHFHRRGWMIAISLTGFVACQAGLMG